MQFRAEDKIVVLGKSECGKSNVCKTIQTLYRHKFIVDSADEYHGPEYTVFRDLNKLAEYLNQIYNQRPERISIVWKWYDHLNQDTIKEQIDIICHMVWNFQAIMFVLEEANDYCNPHYVPHWLGILQRKGRHRKIGTIITAQRPSELYKGLLSEVQKIYFGLLRTKNDVDWCHAYFDNVFNLRSLLVYEFYYFSDSEKKKVKFPLLNSGANYKVKKSKNVKNQT